MFKSLRWWQLTIITAILFLPLFGMSLHDNLGSDAYGYIDRQLCREPLYPLFLMLFKIFGSWQLVMARIAQTILTFLSLLYAADWLQKKLLMKKGLVFSVLLLMSALISLHSKTLTMIWSEGIAFPIFLMIFLKYVEAFEVLSTNNILFISIGTMLLILTRQQFFYLYILFFMLIVWHFWHRESTKNLLRASGIIILVIVIGLGFSAFYYKLITPVDFKQATKKQVTAAEWEFTGWRFTVQPLFLATKKDQLLFKSPVEQKIFLGIYDFLSKRKLTKLSMPEPIANNALDAELYYMAVLGIIQQNVRSAIHTLQPPTMMNAYELDYFLKKMSLVLFLHHFKENAGFYFIRLGYYLANPFVTLAFLITLFAGICRFVVDQNWRPSITQLFVIVGLLFILLNAGLISVVEVFAPRYFFYSYFLYFCFAAILAEAIFSKTSKQP